MSVTTTAQFNQDKFESQLPAGTTYGWTGPPFETAGAKTITASTDDSTVQAAVTVAAASFVDRVANRAALVQKAQTALANNQTYLAIPSPTQAQAVAQVAALTRQVNALIQLALNSFDSTAGT